MTTLRTPMTSPTTMPDLAEAEQADDLADDNPDHDNAEHARRMRRLCQSLVHTDYEVDHTIAEQDKASRIRSQLRC